MSTYPPPLNLHAQVGDGVTSELDNEPFSATVAVINTYLHNNQYPAEKLPELIRQVHNALLEVRGDAPLPSKKNNKATSPLPLPERTQQKSFVPIEQSVEHDYIICLEDGKRVKSLKTYIKRFGLTPDQYRSRWGLPASYPMVTPALSEKRAYIARRTQPHLARKHPGEDSKL